jgi:hypothetical protein
MEAKRLLTADGQEATIDDWNGNASAASLAPDRSLAELFRPAPNNAGGGAQTTKGIVPFSFYGSPATGADFGIVAPSGSADGSVLIPPFRALIGSVSASTPDINWRAARSAVFTGSDATKKTFARQLLAATASNNRWDLVWAKLTLNVNNLTENRYVRDASTAVVTSTSEVVETIDSVTIGVTQGSEGATPTRPSLPADSGSDYYFPLAFVRLVHPHTSGTTLLSRQIQEVAPTIPLARATSAITIQPGNSQYATTGTVIANGGDFTSSARPNAFLPSTMVGGEHRFFAFDWDAATKTHPLSATTTIDDTVDWRRRTFKWFVCAADGAPGDTFVWNAAATDNIPAVTIATGNKDWGFGQSFIDDGTAEAGGVAGGVAAIANITATAFPVYFVVNLTTGVLSVVVGSDPSCRLFLWLEASAPFSNK